MPIDKVAALILSVCDWVPEHPILVGCALGGLVLLSSILYLLAASAQGDAGANIFTGLAHRFGIIDQPSVGKKEAGDE